MEQESPISLEEQGKQEATSQVDENEVFFDEGSIAEDDNGEELSLQDSRLRSRRDMLTKAWRYGLIVLGLVMGMTYWMATKSTTKSTSSPSVTADPDATNSSSTLSPSTETETTTSPPASQGQRPVVYYEKAQTDRTGQQIVQMLRLHAYTFTHQPGIKPLPHLNPDRPAIFGGACRDLIDWESECKRVHGGTCNLEKYMEVQQERFETKKEMIGALGLTQELHFACPTQEDLDSGDAEILDRTEFGIYEMTSDWLDYIRQHSAYGSQSTQQSEEPLKVAVHLRRGDYNPCNIPDKYLPNLYYTDLLDMVMDTYCNATKGCNVTIFSEDDKVPFESFSVFHNYGPIDTQSSLPAIWDALINADIAVLSRSAFSFVPAIFNGKGIILNPVKGHFPSLNQANWISVGEDNIGSTSTEVMWGKTEVEIDRLVGERCN